MRRRITIKEDWKITRGEMKERFASLLRSKAIIYWFFLMFGMAGLSTWITLALYDSDKVKASDVVVSAASYALALGMTSLADVLLDKESRTLGRLLVLALVIASLVPIAYEAGALMLSKEPDRFAIHGWEVVLWLLLPAVVWGVANAMDPRLEAEPPPPDAAAGGDPMQDLGGGHDNR